MAIIMNKKEIAEIKKNFSEGSGFLTLNRVLTAYVDPSKNIHGKTVRLHSIIPEDEGAVLMEMMKKVLSGSLGKNLAEYAFPNSAYEEGGAQKLLYSLVRSKLEDEEIASAFVERIVTKMDYESAYSIVSGYCSYSIMTRDKNDEKSDNVTEEYNFVITAICPVNTGSDGLVFDEESDSIIKKTNTEMIISRAPTDGFIYPVFSDRSPDVNSVMCYVKTADKPNVSVVNDLLECEYVMSPKHEKVCFQQVLNTVVGDELDYTVITAVNEKVKEVVEQSKHETERTVIDDKKLRHILAETGVSEERLECLEAVYKETVGEVALTASNLINSKTVVALPEITINIGKDATDKVRTSIIQGRRCLIIDLDDPTICINGLETTLPQSNAEPVTV